MNTGLAMAFLMVLRPFPCGNFRGGQITIERYTINNNNNNNRNHHNARGPTEWHHVRRRRRRSRKPLDRSPPPPPRSWRLRPAGSTTRPPLVLQSFPPGQVYYNIMYIMILYTRTHLP